MMHFRLNCKVIGKSTVTICNRSRTEIRLVLMDDLMLTFI